MKFKEFARESKGKILATVSTIGVALATSIPCYAAEIDGAMTTALGAVKTDMMGVIAVVAPVGIAIAGALLIWKRGIGFFKSISK